MSKEAKKSLDKAAGAGPVELDDKALGAVAGAGDVNNDGTPDIITAAGPGGGAHVKSSETPTLRR